jgi:hypothetical protein
VILVRRRVCGAIRRNEGGPAGRPELGWRAGGGCRRHMPVVGTVGAGAAEASAASSAFELRFISMLCARW